jgi:hypothetical protein
VSKLHGFLVASVLSAVAIFSIGSIAIPGSAEAYIVCTNKGCGTTRISRL